MFHFTNGTISNYCRFIEQSRAMIYEYNRDVNEWKILVTTRVTECSDYYVSLYTQTTYKRALFSTFFLVQCTGAVFTRSSRATGLPQCAESRKMRTNANHIRARARARTLVYRVISIWREIIMSGFYGIGEGGGSLRPGGAAGEA